MMRSRVFLDLAKRLVIIPHEANWRCAAGRAYYALLLECRDALNRWGFGLPNRDIVHYFVRSRFSNTADANHRMSGDSLHNLSQLRNKADYDMNSSQFRSDSLSKKAINLVDNALTLLDAIDADGLKRAAAIAEIKSRWP